MDDITRLEFHMLDHCVDDQLREELRGYFQRYPFTVVDEITIDGDDRTFSGLAQLETGAIELNRSLLDAPSARALNIYLHEVAHIISDNGHTLNFAALAAGSQQHFRCRDTSKRRLAYDTQESTVDEWRTSEYTHLQRGGSVRPIADPVSWIERRRVSQEARDAARWREQNLWPNLLALTVAVVAVAGIVAWPWVSELFSNEMLTFAVGFVVAAGAILAALVFSDA